MPSTPTIPNPPWQTRVELIRGEELACPSRMGRVKRTKREITHTIEDNSEVSKGDNPSRMTFHIEGKFLFVLAILETSLHELWKMSSFEKYDGTTNPDNHLRTLLNQMMFHVVNDPIWCRVFSSSLTGEALEWFSEFHKITPIALQCWKHVSTLNSPPSDRLSCPQRRSSTFSKGRMNHSEASIGCQ